MWPHRVALHVAACWLDPTLEAFSFIKNIPDRTALLKQAQDIVRSNCIAVANELHCQGNADVKRLLLNLIMKLMMMMMMMDISIQTVKV